MNFVPDMSHEIEKRDNHVYIRMTSPQFGLQNTGGFISEIKSAMLQNPNIVLNAASITSISDEELFKIKELYNANKKLAGIIVVSELADHLIPKLEMIGMNCIPSDDEAVDYIFMEQIERDLLNSME